MPDTPALRVLDNGQAVGIDDILKALKMLDDGDLDNGNSKLKEFHPRLQRNPSRQWLSTILRRRRRDDDDDPPPCPAVTAPAPRLPSSGAENALEAA